jgi:Zn ribbon nucleic-acid-binding protein
MARSSSAAASVPLGSLTQPGARQGAQCQMCQSKRVTRISMELTDGSEVDFTHCLECEHRTWQHGDEVLSVDHVLSRAKRTR